MTEVGKEQVVQETDDRYFLTKDAEGRFTVCYKDDNGELHPRSAKLKDIELVPGMGLFVVTDNETGGVGIIDAKNTEELIGCYFQTVVTTHDRVILVDYHNKAHNIYFDEDNNVIDALKEYNSKLSLKEVFMMGKIAGHWEAHPVYRRNMKEAIISEEKRWAYEEEGDAE